MIEIGSTVEIVRDPPYKEYDIHKGDIGIVTYIAKSGKYSVAIDEKINPHHDINRKYGNDGDFWIPFDYVKEYNFKKGDRVKIVSSKSKYRGKLATVISINIGWNDYVGVLIDNEPINYNNRYNARFAKTSLRLIKNEREDCIMKLTGFTKVAVIEICRSDYYYALYDNNINIGDKVIVSGRCSNSILEVKNILTLEETKEKFNKAITEEVMCKVDLTAYNTRVENRKKAEDLRKKMDQKIAEMDEINKYVMYAERNPELAKMLEEYRELV